MKRNEFIKRCRDNGFRRYEDIAAHVGVNQSLPSYWKRTNRVPRKYVEMIGTTLLEKLTKAPKHVAPDKIIKDSKKQGIDFGAFAMKDVIIDYENRKIIIRF